MQRLPKQVAAVTAALALAVAAASCGSSSSSSSSASSSGGGAVPQVDVTKFTADYAVMKTLQSLAAQGKGKIGVLLPDTTTSTRYVQYDAPNLTKAFEAAGLSSSDFKITNAQGSVSTMQQQAEADITDGASVLLIDPIDTGSGAAIEKNAEAKGLKVIDYDRLVLGGPSDRYYVSFNNVKVGQLIGQGEISCINAWGVKNPNILIMDGDPTDNNAKLFAQGYNGVLAPKFADGTYKKVGEPTGTWDPPTAQTLFEQQYTAHPNINAVVTPNDSNAAAVIAALKNKKIPPKTFPTTGQDAGLEGLQNILAGWQCMTVYKSIKTQADAAATVADGILHAKPINTQGKTVNDGKRNVPSVLLTPVAITKNNWKLLISDGFLKKSEVCTGEYAKYC